MQNNIKEHNKLLTIGQASEYLGVSVDTLRRWEKKGRIEPYRSPGGHRHYDKNDLDKLFDKRYTRDEPTIRSSKDIAGTLTKEIASVKYPEPEQDNLQSIPKVTLPAWRAIKEDSIDDVIESVELLEEKILERPTREVKIPENTRIQVAREEAVVSPNETYFRQQTVSVLTPPSHPATIHQPSIPTTNSEKTGQINAQENNKALLIYLSVMASIVLFGIAWYFLWRNSQAVLSPIP